MMFGQSTDIESGVVLETTLVDFNRFVWNVLDPQIQAAIADRDVNSLRKIEGDIRLVTQTLVQYGLYRVQREAYRLSSEADKEKTRRELFWEASEQDIMFARAMNAEDVLDFAEEVWQVIRLWMLANNVPDDIMQLIGDLGSLTHGGSLLLGKHEMHEWEAADLTNSLSRSAILLHAKKAKESACGHSRS